MRLPFLIRLIACVLTVAAFVLPAAAQPASLPQSLTPLVEPAIAQPPPDDSEWWRDGGPRIRTSDVRAALILRLGLERSAILRDLVEEIESGQVIVYVGLSSDMPGSLAGSLRFAGTAGRFRYLRVLVNGDLSAEQMVASLAHELQHVREVMASPDVQDEKSLEDLYRRIGRENRVAGRVGWETDQARAIGADVRRELSAGVAAILARRYDSGRRGVVR